MSDQWEEAKALIDELTAENERLREALRRIADGDYSSGARNIAHSALREASRG